MSELSPRKYSVFLRPAAADGAWCETRIAELSAKCDVAPFEPHVTVFSVFLDLSYPLVEAVAAAIRDLPPLCLRVSGVGCSEDYFKSLFISFTEDAALRNLHDAIRSAVPAPSEYELVPHLSLLYGDIPLAAKQALAKRVTVDREGMLFDSVSIVTPGNEREGWRDTGRWHTVYRSRLPGRQEGEA